MGSLDLEASEMAIRMAMRQLGGVLLEKLLNADGGGQGHQAEFGDYSSKSSKNRSNRCRHFAIWFSVIPERASIKTRGQHLT